MTLPRYIDAFTGSECGPPDGELLRVDDGGASAYLHGPALFDPQVNGFGGVDFQDPRLDAEALESAVSQIRRAGCSHILLTLITESAGSLEAQLARVGRCLDERPALRNTILGIHLEGPFLRDEAGYAGAHAREHLRFPDWELFRRFQDAAGGRIRLVTLAPELPRAVDLIGRLAEAGVWVAVGHTDASMAELREAVAAGARLATHLGNGCPPILPRHDNIIQRILAVPELMATVIPDGEHVPAPALGNMLRLLGPDRLAMTTDSMSAAAAPAGSYTLGELALEVGEDRRVVHPNGDQFAGSTLRMVEGLNNAVRIGGLDVRSAWGAWTRLRDRMFPGQKTPILALPHAGDEVEEEG